MWNVVKANTYPSREVLARIKVYPFCLISMNSVTGEKETAIIWVVEAIAQVILLELLEIVLLIRLSSTTTME